ncbi:MAG: multiprotein bridging factor aMBF1 [Thermoplasmata archaeon]
MNCELCGKEIKHYHEVIIDGATMKVCDECAKYGKEVRQPSSFQIPRITKVVVQSPVSNPIAHPPMKKRTPRELIDDDEPVLDFGKIIKKRREELGMSQEELAVKLQEKKNLLAKIEREEIKPDKATAKKIEKILGIKIMEKIQ